MKQSPRMNKSRTNIGNKQGLTLYTTVHTVRTPMRRITALLKSQWVFQPVSLKLMHNGRMQ